jgi:16S rRNA processing protein RimM
MPEGASDDVVLIGRVIGLFGIKGWVKVHSYTRLREGILDYDCWKLKIGEGWHDTKVLEGRKQAGGVVARLEGIEDRDSASRLVGADIAIARNQLPTLKRGEVYWADLEGLKVVNLEGVELGTVSHLFETGSNDVMVVQGERERLIPYIADAIREVDLIAGIVRVDWDKDF